MDNQLAPFNQLSDMLQSLYADVFRPTELPEPKNDNQSWSDVEFMQAVFETQSGVVDMFDKT